ncbi:class I SAM-dependent methyltransferase [Peterkaempfera bronchialis]|uniref:Methyltransferase domain-containing protein n=1 Tax=Peterkaempfera bronchialis TaxID=2126346 RepID=A0A345SZ02_9ACTN|nr:methyltransferase domain-containing protein [Peterkaempfera bronchialis]AXI78957.1 methyltransferase domain-containing protein [Peterkaempfera bronchialis]
MTPHDEQITALLTQLDQALGSPATTHGLARTLRAAVKEVELHRHHRASVADLSDGVLKPSPTKIQIGGGGHRIEGFLNIDIVPPADLLWDVREGIPLADDSTQEVFSEHFLEHIDYPRSAKHYAHEAHRVLAPGGQLITGVPDAAYVLSQYPAPPEQATEMIERWYAKRECRSDINTYLDLINYVFRDQDDDPTYNPHYWAYDHGKLVQLFCEAGFKTVEPWTFDPTMANPKRRWASVYVIATK